MRIFEEYITPKTAEKYLEQNTNNYRRMNRNKVAIYARDMKNGSWQTNGEAIKFNKRGELVDGQHRLKAIMEADVPVKMLVIRDVENYVTVYDCGKSRSLREIALAENIPARLADGTMTGAAAIIVMGDPRGTKAGGSKSEYPSKMEIINHISKHIDRWDKVYSIVRTYKYDNHGNVVSRKSVIHAAVYYLLSVGKDETELNDFFGVVGSGFPINGVECSPAIVLRNMLLNWNASNEDRVKYFCATVDAFTDFENGIARTKAYSKTSNKTLSALKELSIEERG